MMEILTSLSLTKEQQNLRMVLATGIQPISQTQANIMLKQTKWQLSIVQSC